MPIVPITIADINVTPDFILVTADKGWKLSGYAKSSISEITVDKFKDLRSDGWMDDRIDAQGRNKSCEVTISCKKSWATYTIRYYSEAVADTPAKKQQTLPYLQHKLFGLPLPATAEVNLLFDS